MIFTKKPYVHAGERKPARILALFSDGFIGDIRIKPYLNALLGRGVIADYRIADRAMTLTGPGPYAFTHIWCQRNISSAQFSFLKAHRHVPIVYDLDDLLTQIPDFVASSKRATHNRIIWCLQNATCVTVASEALRAHLRQQVAATEGKIAVLKNGCADAGPPQHNGENRQLVWTSSDVPFFLREHPDFVRRLAELLNRSGYEAVLIGRFDVEIRSAFAQAHHISHLDFLSFRNYLRSRAGGIAIAPLPMQLPAKAQQYFDAKSDVKLVDYLSAGLVPIVSRALPYATSELFMPQLAAKSADEMLQIVETCIATPDMIRQQIDTTIHQPGLLAQRTFAELSKVLDPLFI
ncbi:hypothetical protein [Afipia sp. P52-10]|jgi:hypothetical protein|uniref:hypothetical protein n=1 Tax=Afipia sp. P52-10 TaxID=1429916 RepID=UPI0004B86840|nr:hypothetical protein [Afipia sp. P52-10]